jgi:carbamoyl-phosphate synthase large subunit
VSLPPITVVVSASGAPGTAALLRALRENGERDVRLVGTDMSERSVGRHLCDAFHLVPSGSDPGFADAMRAVAEREGAHAVLPQSSFDLEGLATHRDTFPVPVLVSRPDTIRRSNDKAETYAFLHRLGVRAPEFRRVHGARDVETAAHQLGYPDRPVCFKPVFSSGSRGFRVLDPTVDRAHQLLDERPGSVAMRLEEALELLPDEGGTELLVMELATGGERTIDGIANGRDVVLGHPKTREAMRAGLAMYFVTLEDDELMELATGGERTIDGIANGRDVVLGHPKTREAMRAGLAMYFVTLEDDELMELAGKIVAELAIEHFFNIQLVGEHVIEVNPRISTIVYQKDFNLPYLGVKRALGEITDDELRPLRSRVRPGRTALRYFDQLEWDE